MECTVDRTSCVCSGCEEQEGCARFIDVHIEERVHNAMCKKHNLNLIKEIAKREAKEGITKKIEIKIYTEDYIIVQQKAKNLNMSVEQFLGIHIAQMCDRQKKVWLGG